MEETTVQEIIESSEQGEEISSSDMSESSATEVESSEQSSDLETTAPETETETTLETETETETLTETETETETVDKLQAMNIMETSTELPFLVKPFSEYSTTEGLLLLIFVLMLITFIYGLFERGR